MCSDGLNPVPQVGFTDVQILGSLTDTNALAEGNCFGLHVASHRRHVSGDGLTSVAVVI